MSCHPERSRNRSIIKARLRAKGLPARLRIGMNGTVLTFSFSFIRVIREIRVQNPAG